MHLKCKNSNNALYIFIRLHIIQPQTSKSGVVYFSLTDRNRITFTIKKHSAIKEQCDTAFMDR